MQPKRGTPALRFRPGTITLRKKIKSLKYDTQVITPGLKAIIPRGEKTIGKRLKVSFGGTTNVKTTVHGPPIKDTHFHVVGNIPCSVELRTTREGNRVDFYLNINPA